jgi:hypothetical protein
MSDLLLLGRVHDSFLVFRGLAFRPGHLSIFNDRNRWLGSDLVGNLSRIYESIILTHRSQLVVVVVAIEEGLN